MSSKIFNLTSIAIGGAIGTLFRYNLNVNVLFSNLPNATLIENLLGSFLLGCFAGWLFHNVISEWLQLGLSVGLLGGFTTMSTFSMEAIGLLHRKAYKYFFLYTLLTITGSITLFYIGFIF